MDMKNFRIVMRDGVTLSTDVYFPQDADDFPYPVIIERTPYDKKAPSRSEKTVTGHQITRQEMARCFTHAGFIVIYQDCRGRYESEGKFTKYINEAEDGFDTLQWIMAQPWCNGKIGSMGLSYAAHTQLAMACLNPPGLSTMVLDSGGFANAFQCGIRQGGAFELKQATWAYKQAKLSPLAQQSSTVSTALAQENIHDWFAAMPWHQGHTLLKHVPEYESYLFEQWEEECFTDYWKKIGIYAEGYYDQIPDIPVLFMSSWYDAYVSSTLDNYRAFTTTKQSPQKLIMGPWLHGDRNITHSGNAEFGEVAAFDHNVSEDWLACRLVWFNTHLKGLNPPKPQQDITFFMMGGGSGKRNSEGRLEHGGEWLHHQQWPLPNVEKTPFFLWGNQSLQREECPKQATISYCYDPKYPVPTIGGALTSGQPIFWGGAFDQRELPDFFGSQQNNLPLSARPDVLVFETDILQDDICLAGDIEVSLWISSDALDTDFTAKLIDVYPPNEDYPQGYAMNITDGIFRCRFHQGYEQKTLLNPNEVVEIKIKPFACANRFVKGHRIRLDISSSNFPKYDFNTNTGETIAGDRTWKVAHNSIHISKRYPSKVVLPIVKKT
ncbi:TPA: CocE/NonD family hydrolase [Providencia rettgeri]|uniref:CocE/NonD family hydrolase n=1 Tax=Providencia TaxID=586 RepID=UPI00234A8839|nr:CocE/NonD family hydrolase [Providencia sp. PROV197]HEM8291170.1 CocE/NonD family hydrolase [Providencia stuartii]